MVYDAALVTSVQSNAIGCEGALALAGDRSVGAPGVGGGATGALVVALTSIFVTKASPQNIERLPAKTVSNAQVVAGKSIENVWPLTYTSPTLSMTISNPPSPYDPPCSVEYSSAEPAGFNSEMKASAPPFID